MLVWVSKIMSLSGLWKQKLFHAGLKWKLCWLYIFQIDRLKLLVREWEEKAESSELQINSISREYRTLLEEKEVGLL